MSSTNRAALAWDIARCPFFMGFDRGEAGACTTIIGSQRLDVANRYPPESWTGPIASARVMFITSNPNTTPGTPPRTPLPTSPNELLDFNEGYFDSHPVHAVPTWRRLPLWASQILGVEPSEAIGMLAITDVVRCASRQQQGVWAALGQCARTWLPKVLEISGADVVAWCGSAARTALREHLPHDRIALRSGEIWGPDEFYGRERMLVGLPHPADRFKARDRVADLGVQVQRLGTWIASRGGAA